MAPSTFSHASKLQDARVLVLGGTSGIGFAVAEAALSQGAYVTISSSNTRKLNDSLQRLKGTFSSLASKIDGFACDLSNPTTLEANIKELFDKVTKNGKLDHIVFTAGDVSNVAPVPETSFEAIQKNGVVRFYAPLLVAKYATAGHLVSSPKSSITLTGGTLSHRPTKNWTTLSAWGSGVEGVMRGLAVDLAPTRVNLVSPGAVDTELFQAAPESVKNAFADNSLVGEIGTPHDVAEAYIFCMRSAFVDGQVLVVDGGRLIKE